MAGYAGIADLKAALSSVGSVGKEGIEVRDRGVLRGRVIDDLVYTAVFAKEDGLRDAARWAIRAAAAGTGARSASIHDLYCAVGRGEARGFTVPAVNIRTLTYDFARTLLRALRSLGAGTAIFEIAKSEIGYTFQRPAEYAACVLAAAVKEGWEGPVFLQGDHFQFSAKAYAKDPEKEAKGIREICLEALAAGFLNIDIDASTLVDLSKPTVREQQRVNFGRGAELTKLIRRNEPAGITVSVGGEIGEVGGKNSTVEELKAYVDGYREILGEDGGGPAGIRKVSVQTGTSHGGIPLPDGHVAPVALDFGVLRELSRVARRDYGIGGAVQHGASTLPQELFDRFPEHETLEIHLATEFQNILLDHPAFPRDLKAQMAEWCRKNCQDEAKPGQTDEQFFYKTRKKAWGPFKQAVWDLAAGAREALTGALAQKLEYLFRKLKIEGNAPVVEKHIRHPGAPLPPAPASLAGHP